MSTLRLGRFVDDFEDALACRPSGLDQLVELMQFAHRLVEKTGQQKEGAEIAQLNRLGQNILCSYRYHQENAEGAEQIHRGVVDCPYFHHHESGAPQSVTRSVKANVFLALAHKALDLTNAGKVVVQQRIHGGGGAAL